MARSITIYGRPDCHLCAEAEARVREIAAGEAVEVVDIELDDELHRRYLEKIPVILVDGLQVAELVEYRASSFERMLLESLSG